MTLFNEFIRLGSNFSGALPLLSYILVVIYFTITKVPRYIHVVFMICLISTATDAITFVLYAKKIHTALFLNIQDVLNFGLSIWFYYEILFKNTKKLPLIIGVVVYVLFYIFITVEVQDLYQYQGFAWAIQCIIVLGFGISYSQYLLQNAMHPPELLSSKLWLNGANLFYFGFSFWLFVLSTVLLVEIDKDTVRTVWMFHNTNNIIKNILFAIGIYSSLDPEERDYNLFDKPA